MENELSIKISASAERALKSLDKLIPKINQTDNCVSKMLMNFDKNGQLTGFTTELKKLGPEMDKITNKSKNLKSALNLGITFAGVSKIFRTGLSWMQNSIDYSEALNLFNVVLDESIDKGTKFQNVMNEAFGTNKTETLTRQGLYQSMAENMKIPMEYAYIMSETSTKLVNDIASLYNKDENTVAEAIRAGVFAGQTKPLRSFGMDITESSLQPILNELGLKNSDGTDRTVRQLSQAEKQILRYIAVLRQSSEAHGDWANTIEAPANQLKIFKNQAVEASRAFSNLFIGTFGNILPYANAMLMVIKEVSNALASMFGIEITDYNTGIADMSDAFVDIEDSTDSASDSVKELKRQILGFDQINNISENKDSGTSSNLIGTIDQKLLDSIYSYDNGMESVRMKATQIRDQIMEWLGFTKEINPLTGEVSFKYDGIDKTLKNVWKSFKGLSNTGKILVTLGLVAGAVKLYNSGKKILSLLSGTGLVKQTNNLLSPLKTLPKYLDDINFSNTTLTQGLKQQITKWGQSLDSIEKFKLGVIGLSGLAITFATMAQSMDNVSRNGINLGNSLGVLSSGIGSIASGAMLGTSILPGWGTAIGACAGGILSLISALKGYKSQSDLNLEATEKQLEASKKYYQSLEEEREQIDKNCEANLLIHNNNEKLLEELQNLVDANGKVKEGYENRVKFILGELNSAYGTEYTLVNGQISQYETLKDKIETVIAKKKLEIMLEANKEKYTLALQNEEEAYNNLYDAEEKYKKSHKELKATEEKLIIKKEELNSKRERLNELTSKGIERTREEQNEMFLLEGQIRNLTNEIKELNTTKEQQDEVTENNRKTYENYKNSVDSYTKDIMNYENLLTASYSESATEINNAIDSVRNNSDKSTKEIVAKYLNSAESVLRVSRDTNGEILKDDETKAQTLINNAVNTLLEQSQVIEQLSPDVIAGWRLLGEKSNVDFQNALKKVDPSVRNEILSQVGSIGTEAGKKMGDSLKEAFSFTTNGLKVTTYADGTVRVTKKADGGVFSNGKWQNIAQYANGGLPPIGQMFIAREKGPELVGSIGNKTAVMNNNQIVESVKAGVYEAVATAMSQVNFGSSQDIRVYAEEGIIVEKAVRGIQQHVNQTGELPFTVPA